MKRILCLVLFAAMMCLLLAGCGNKAVGGYLDIYDEEKLWVPEVKETIELDFYIITGDDTTDNAIKTVERSIATYVEDKFSTILDIHYVTADEYRKTVNDAVVLEGEDRADIVLINSVDLYKDIKSNLVDISGYYKTNKNYGALKTQIASSLIAAATEDDGKILCVPNNHVVGEYEYVLINKKAAQHVNYSENKITPIIDIESADAKALCDAIDSTGIYNSADCVKKVTGMYEDKAKYEAEGYYCNIALAPTVDDEEVFQSAFAIVKDPKDNSAEYIERYNRAMEVIWALNTDSNLRNRLQYGNKGTNYEEIEVTLEDGSVVIYAEPFKTGSGVYSMDILYTGDMFKAYYSDSLGWTVDAFNNGKLQNKDSVTP